MKPKSSDLETIQVPAWSLGQVNARVPLNAYFRQLWHRRHFIIAESRAKVIGGNQRDYLGIAWMVIQPILSALAFFVIFGVILQTSRGIDNFLGYLLIGVFFFGFTTRVITTCAGGIKANQAMIKAFTFPRASIPISVVVREIMNFVPSVIVMMLMILVLPPAEILTWRVIYVIPAFLLQVMFSLGVGFVVARLCHIIPDLVHLISILTRFWLYASGVFFSIDRFVTNEVMSAVMKANPMYGYLMAVRNSLLYGVDTPLWMWLNCAGWALLFFVFGFLFFYRGESTYGLTRD